jgi:replication initiation and membrane attachment protein DnaB
MAIQCNVSVDEFYNITPYELNIIIECYVDNQTNKYKDLITQAYFTAYFQRVKKMPKLEKLLNDVDRKLKKQQTAEEMFEVVKRLNSALGGAS